MEEQSTIFSVHEYKDADILNIISSLISEDYLKFGQLSVKSNKELPNSIVYSAASSVYRNEVNNYLLCNCKTTGKENCRYVRFPEAYAIRLNDLKIPFTTIPSNASPRVALDVFVNFCLERSDEARKLFCEMLEAGFSIERFDCCSRFQECSAAGKCVHPDKIYATACGYRKNLIKGKIFY